jgi:hypothetical protein
VCLEDEEDFRECIFISRIFLFGIPAYSRITIKINKCPGLAQGIIHSNRVL